MGKILSRAWCRYLVVLAPTICLLVCMLLAMVFWLYRDSGEDWLSAKTIASHVQEIMELDEEGHYPFVRWEQPVRYYLAGLDDYPRLERVFEQQMRVVAEIVGVDVGRHDDLYINLHKDPAKNRVGPRGYGTTVAIFFSDDAERTFQNPKVVGLLRGFGDAPKEKHLVWMKHNDENDPSLSYSRFALDEHGFQLFFSLVDVRYFAELSDSRPAYLQREMFEYVMKAFFELDPNRRREKSPRSIFNAEPRRAPEITGFDKEFMKTYYMMSCDLE